MGLFKSIQTAFKNRWNLLGLAGGTALAFISGRPDILLPVVLAAETAYLGLLGTHPKFQKFVAAQEHKSRKEETSTQSMDRMLKTLTSKQRSKFTKLCRRCDHLRGIAKDIRQVDGDGKRTFIAESVSTIGNGSPDVDLSQTAVHRSAIVPIL